MLLITNDCSCKDPKFCICQTKSSSYEKIKDEDEPKPKICMAQNQSDGNAQMLAQIKSLLEGEMKAVLLDSFLKTMVKSQKPTTTTNSGKKPLFIYASFERNTKSFVRQNQNDKMRPLTINDLRKEINILKKEVAEIKQRLEKIGKESENEDGYKADSWDRQEIRGLQQQIQALQFMPPLEEIPQNANTSISTFETNSIECLNSMRIMAIQH
jgi:hypothetical protein